MDQKKKKPPLKGNSKPSIFGLLKPYRLWIIGLIILSFLANYISLQVPQIIRLAMDTYQHGNYNPLRTAEWFVLVAILGFLFSYLQSIVQTLASEKVAYDLRNKLSDQISKQSQAFIEKANPNKLLTNLTADVDSIKLFISQALVSIASSIFIIFGASYYLISMNWKLALLVMTIVPLIGTAFYLVLKQVRELFKKSREVIDSLNKVINESILGSSLIRVFNSQQVEFQKFFDSNIQAKNLGLSILKLFAGLIPLIIFISSLASLSILLLGGHFVIDSKMSLGEFQAFNQYLALLIFPIMIIGFMSNVMAQASASYERIYGVLNVPETPIQGTRIQDLKGEVRFENVSVNYGQKLVLKNISFDIKPGKRIAIIGPTAAGKSQLLYLLTGLINPSSGRIFFDGTEFKELQPESFYKQVGFVFQDSILFNMSLRENIAFSQSVTDESLEKALETSELKDFIQTLPGNLNAMVSERGTSLSGGQKQRLMLARALAINPKILLLDDFTARVDNQTETRILENLEKNYPGITLISVTQKISTARLFDKIILIMQGEILAEGTHEDLMKSSPEYVQIFQSQQSTSNFELDPSLQ